ncbi:hypothetical protein K431DRAFT_235136 [Polychaeton citri CBS 116435]|uniref:Uncharacterized protein n=1 Tax=Polychaeton citri CBS 116435 TaxID=1314669 RepID=A0A9P4PZB5_9PEZI|nr:hypothetical protein K431DRAFT_235136 [Polychaeton citri CBS 116435]
MITTLVFVLAGVSADLQRLYLTALLSDEAGELRFECWEMEEPFHRYPTVGMAMQAFANVSNISYVVIPPRSSEGFHKPPHPMFFVLLAGLAHVRIPGQPEDLWIAEGMGNLMIAADTIGKGHITDYPLNKETVALQIPFRDGVSPAHQVAKDGVCDRDVEKSSRFHFEARVVQQTPLQ